MRKVINFDGNQKTKNEAVLGPDFKVGPVNKATNMMCLSFSDRENVLTLSNGLQFPSNKIF